MSIVSIVCDKTGLKRLLFLKLKGVKEFNNRKRNRAVRGNATGTHWEGRQQDRHTLQGQHLHTTASLISQSDSLHSYSHLHHQNDQKSIILNESTFCCHLSDSDHWRSCKVKRRPIFHLNEQRHNATTTAKQSHKGCQ